MYDNAWRPDREGALTKCQVQKPFCSVFLHWELGLFLTRYCCIVVPALTPVMGIQCAFTVIPLGA